MLPIDFYFDFISPFSYFAVRRLPAIAERFGRAIKYHVVDLAVLKLEAGNTAPPTRNMPIKLRYMKVDQARWARRYGVPVRSPAYYDSGLLNRGMFFAQKREQVSAYVASTFHKVRGEGGHMTHEILLSRLAAEFGWDAAEFRKFTSSVTADTLYQESTESAHRRGIFGVPTMMIGYEMWWGNDRLVHGKFSFRSQLTN
jgi:2-hydroxychromene-2-carboxylate isomerase